MRSPFYLYFVMPDPIGHLLLFYRAQNFLQQPALGKTFADVQDNPLRGDEYEGRDLVIVGSAR